MLKQIFGWKTDWKQVWKRKYGRERTRTPQELQEYLHMLKGNVGRRINDTTEHCATFVEECILTKLNCQCRVEEETFWNDAMTYAKIRTEAGGEIVCRENVTQEMVFKYCGYMQYYLAFVSNRFKIYFDHRQELSEMPSVAAIKVIFRATDSVNDFEAAGIRESLLRKTNQAPDCPEEHALKFIYSDVLSNEVFWSTHMATQVQMAKHTRTQFKIESGISYDDALTLLYHFEKHGKPELGDKSVGEYMARVRDMWDWSGEAPFDRRRQDEKVKNKFMVKREQVVLVVQEQSDGLVKVLSCHKERRAILVPGRRGQRN